MNLLTLKIKLIVAKFFYSKSGFCEGFSVKGHAGSGEYGQDLVCCAVSAVVQMCCNGLTEVAKCSSAKVCCSDGFVRVWVKSKACEVQVLLQTLELELFLLAKQHGKNLKFLKLEV